MKRTTHKSTFGGVLLAAALLVTLPVNTYAQGDQNVQPRNYSTKAAMQTGNEKGWAKVTTQCAVVNDACAQAAIVEVSIECAADAQLFSRDTKKWQYLGFALIIASAAFTGVGASSTIANAKVYSTLGGTTGLGAVTSTVNANTSSDQSGLAAVNTVLTAFLKFVQTGGADGKSSPTPAQIYASAPIYASQCGAAASSSPGKTGPATTTAK